MEKRHKVTTKKQFQLLISELEKKPKLARGNHGGTAVINTFRQDWEEITIKLNAHGPPIRDCDGWLRVWRDFKFKLRKKLLQKKTGKNNSFDEKNKNVFLFPFEEAAAKLIFPGNQLSDESVFLAPAVEEIKSELLDQTMWEEEKGFPSENESNVEEAKTEDFCMLDATFLDDDYLPSTSAKSFQVHMLASPDRKKRKRKYKSDQRKELLEKHNDMQKKVFNEILKTLKELKNILADSSQCQQKMLEVEERKLQLMQRKDEREEQLYEAEMRLKVLEMKIRSTELEGLEHLNS